MRKGFLYFILFFSTSLFSQTINPFKLDYVDWEILSCTWWNSPPPDTYHFNHYKLCGDTIYQGVTYKRILNGTATQYAPYPGASPTFTMSPPSNYSFYGFFRQDSLLKRNYLRLASWSHDSLLMDYNLHVGDTIKSGLYHHQAPSCINYVVIAVDSILISGYKFKRFYTDSLGGTYLRNYVPGYFFVEGLGHINGIFQEPMFEEYYCHPFENCPGVDTIRFSAQAVSVMEFEQSNRLRIYPVPSKNSVNFSERVDGTIRMVNSLGQKVLEAACRNCQELDITDLPKGIYLIEITEGSSVLRRKIIKE